mmetsp:Transcript_111889/g.312806  ORF Transcript_111889/g.312806 Transcript_111889/m.312806 type:complete len:364 (-) Transcript_111889:78-1169(-)
MRQTILPFSSVNMPSLFRLSLHVHVWSHRCHPSSPGPHHFAAENNLIMVAARAPACSTSWPYSIAQKLVVDVANLSPALRFSLSTVWLIWRQVSTSAASSVVLGAARVAVTVIPRALWSLWNVKVCMLHPGLCRYPQSASTLICAGKSCVAFWPNKDSNILWNFEVSRGYSLSLLLCHHSYAASLSKPRPSNDASWLRISATSRRFGRSNPDAANTSGCLHPPQDAADGCRNAKRSGPVMRTSKQHLDSVATSPTMGASPKRTVMETSSVEPVEPPSRRSISGLSSGRWSWMPRRTAETRSQAEPQRSSRDLSPAADSASAPHLLKDSTAVGKSLHGNGVPPAPKGSLEGAATSLLRHDNVSG